MKITEHNHKEIRFLCREGTSDLKTFEEVIVRNVYEKKYFKIEAGEHWIDLGGNVGAFAIQAIRKGATVDIYEPDPYNCKMIERNLNLNNMTANIYQKAAVSSDKKKMYMYVGNDMQVWRNSLYKDWGNQKFSVDCIHFSEVLNEPKNCVKMDIEGAEMDILENMNVFPNKMVFEWSLDIDRSLTRYRKMIDKFKTEYNKLMYKEQFYSLPDESLPNHIFPKADNVYCYEKN